MTAESARLDRLADLRSVVDARTLELLERRSRAAGVWRRGWLVRRALVGADLLGLSIAFLVAELSLRQPSLQDNAADGESQVLLFVLTLPLWVVVAKLHGLYERDEERTHHTTVDDFTRVFHVVTVGAWIVFAGPRLLGIADLDLFKISVFWGVAIVAIPALRAGARACCQRHLSYLQNTIIVGEGEVGQLIARKLLQHPEYGVNLVGFVDVNARKRRSDLDHVPHLGAPGRLADLVSLLDVERVIVAFTRGGYGEQLTTIRSLNDRGVQIDVVPRLWEIVTPNADLHTVEGLPLVGLRPVKLSRSSRLLKRAIDLAVAGLMLAAAAPFFVYVAWRIKRDSPGPVFFRQTRIGLNSHEFTMLKFRTMKVGTADDEHRAYIRATMDRNAGPEAGGVFKLQRRDAVTRVGRWLRGTSLDELPQLINVLRGEMSLVGPRPCLPYEVEGFEEHHFERFHVPAGITGLWQVTARAHSTFAEALEMDVAYARGWSLALDLKLLLLTPVQLLRQRATR